MMPFKNPCQSVNQIVKFSKYATESTLLALFIQLLLKVEKHSFKISYQTRPTEEESIMIVQIMQLSALKPLYLIPKTTGSLHSGHLADLNKHSKYDVHCKHSQDMIQKYLSFINHKRNLILLEQQSTEEITLVRSNFQGHFPLK